MADGCDSCGGDGVIDVDRFAPGRGHYTLTKPCPKCHGAPRYGDPREQMEFAFEESRPVIDLYEAVRRSIEARRG